MEKHAFPISEKDLELLKERADYINQFNNRFEEIKKSLFNYLQYTYTDQCDNQKTLFEIKFNAVTFHDLKDKSCYEYGGFLNWNVLGIHTIRVKYLEGILSGGYGAYTKLKIKFLWNNLLSNRVERDGISVPYYNGFDDDKLCFAKTFVFQTSEQYEAFKNFHKRLSLLAKELGLNF